MIKTLVVIPRRDNQGRPYPWPVWQELHDRLTLLGGYTRAPSEGEWVAQGQRYRDRSYSYTVSLDSIKQLPAWLDIVRWAQQAFSQEAMYVEVAGQPEVVSW